MLKEMKSQEETREGKTVDTLQSGEVDARLEAGKDVSEGGEKKKSIKNAYAFILILVGLLAGSIFVDVAQLLSGQGVSQRALSKSDVFEMGGKTWVAYTEPAVPVQVIADDSCEKCDPSQALVFFRRYIPTILAKNVQFDSAEGKRLVEDFHIKTLPAFVFGDTIEQTLFYTQAQPLFIQQDKMYVLNTAQMGVPVGKYISFPSVDEQTASVGSQDAKVKIIEFSDFQCPYCRLMHPTITKVLKEYGDKISYAYKHLPLDIHPQANNAALASECAHEQGKFSEYGNLLFSKQDDWAKTEGTAKFKQYALQLRLDAKQFGQCLDSKKYQDKIDTDRKEAADFGISGTPFSFVNREFLSGAVDYDTLKKMVDDELAKE